MNEMTILLTGVIAYLQIRLAWEILADKHVEPESKKLFNPSEDLGSECPFYRTLDPSQCTCRRHEEDN